MGDTGKRFDAVYCTGCDSVEACHGGQGDEMSGVPMPPLRFHMSCLSSHTARPMSSSSQQPSCDAAAIFAYVVSEARTLRLDCAQSEVSGTMEHANLIDRGLVPNQKTRFLRVTL